MQISSRIALQPSARACIMPSTAGFHEFPASRETRGMTPNPMQRRVDRLQNECDVEAGPPLLLAAAFAALILWQMLQAVLS